jgi:hypothetical protein
VQIRAARKYAKSDGGKCRERRPAKNPAKSLFVKFTILLTARQQSGRCGQSWYSQSSFFQILYWIYEIAMNSRVFFLDLPTNIDL